MRRTRKSQVKGVSSYGIILHKMFKINLGESVFFLPHMDTAENTIKWPIRHKINIPFVFLQVTARLHLCHPPIIQGYFGHQADSCLWKSHQTLETWNSTEHWIVKSKLFFIHVRLLMKLLYLLCQLLRFTLYLQHKMTPLYLHDKMTFNVQTGPKVYV